MIAYQKYQMCIILYMLCIINILEIPKSIGFEHKVLA